MPKRYDIPQRAKDIIKMSKIAWLNPRLSIDFLENALYIHLHIGMSPDYGQSARAWIYPLILEHVISLRMLEDSSVSDKFLVDNIERAVSDLGFGAMLLRKAPDRGSEVYLQAPTQICDRVGQGQSGAKPYSYKCPECVTTEGRSLTDDQYQAWLRLAYVRIESGLPLVFYENWRLGSKGLYCSWGMCNDDLLAWPWNDTWSNPEHTVPTGPFGNQKVSHISRCSGQLCPFDNSDMGYAGYGCFYRCRIFRFFAANQPTRKDALKLISALEENFDGH